MKAAGLAIIGLVVPSWLNARYELTLPAGWSASAVTFNHEPAKPIIDRSTYTWQLSDLPYTEHEPGGPSAVGLAPRLAVSFIPPGNSSGLAGRCIRSWPDASEWLSELMAGQDAFEADMSAKVRELTASAKSEYEKVQAIGTFVQNLKYVSIQMNLARGGGYKPHAAATVFQKQYGDCKDKANLMRALLKAAGIDSHLVVIYAGDRTLVREEWPSPVQFNHAIIAVRVGEETKAPTIVVDCSVGRLLIFDPTDPNTPLGDLPRYEQGSLALVIAGNKGNLMRMPATPAGSNSTEMSVQGSLSESGELKAVLTDTDTGQSAARFRARFKSQRPEEQEKLIEQWFNNDATAAQISKIEPQDGFAANRYTLHLEFLCPRFGQLMQSRLLVFKPSVLDPREGIDVREEKRTSPVILYAETYRKEVRIKLPTNFSVDEMPDSGKLEAPFAEFK